MTRAMKLIHYMEIVREAVGPYFTIAKRDDGHLSINIRPKQKKKQRWIVLYAIFGDDDGHEWGPEIIDIAFSKRAITKTARKIAAATGQGVQIMRMVGRDGPMTMRSAK